jgi:hypothetical protein
MFLCLDRDAPRHFLCQVKLGRNAPAEEGGEETVSLANLELVEELRAASQDGGDWPAAVLKVNTPKASLLF